jgi:hypothetical protein
MSSSLLSSAMDPVTGTSLCERDLVFLFVVEF